MGLLALVVLHVTMCICRVRDKGCSFTERCASVAQRCDLVARIGEKRDCRVASASS